MKKRFITILAMLVAVSILVPFSADAVTDASGRVTIYNQYGKPNGQYTYSYQNGFGIKEGAICGPGASAADLVGRKDCLAQAGCCLFAYAHAIQWVSGTKASDQLLLDLLAYCENPSNQFNDHSYSGCQTYPHESSFDAYNLYAHENGMTAMYYNRDGIKMDLAELRSLFGDGYALVIHATGHYVCAVDYVICDSSGLIVPDDGTLPEGHSMYIQIIDSSSNSSTKKGRAFYDKVYEITTSPDGDPMLKKNLRFPHYRFRTANSYWIKIDSLSVCAAVKGS